MLNRYSKLYVAFCLQLASTLECQNDQLHYPFLDNRLIHYNDIVMSAMSSQITSLTIVYPTVCSGEDQRKHQSCSSLAFVRGVHQ